MPLPALGLDPTVARLGRYHEVLAGFIHPIIYRFLGFALDCFPWGVRGSHEESARRKLRGERQ